MLMGGRRYEQQRERWGRWRQPITQFTQVVGWVGWLLVNLLVNLPHRPGQSGRCQSGCYSRRRHHHHHGGPNPGHWRLASPTVAHHSAPKYRRHGGPPHHHIFRGYHTSRPGAPSVASPGGGAPMNGFRVSTWCLRGRKRAVIVRGSPACSGVAWGAPVSPPTAVALRSGLAPWCAGCVVTLGDARCSRPSRPATWPHR